VAILGGNLAILAGNLAILADNLAILVRGPRMQVAKAVTWPS